MVDPLLQTNVCEDLLENDALKFALESIVKDWLNCESPNGWYFNINIYSQRNEFDNKSSKRGNGRSGNKQIGL